jgi:hypothetical protein
MKSKLKLGFIDTHSHLAQFFYNILSVRYNIQIDNINPEYLIFGDENFGTQNLKFSKKDVIKIFYTGENRRPQNYDCHYSISFDHSINTWNYRLPLFVIYMWALEHIHKTEYTFDYILQKHTNNVLKSGFCSFVVSNPNCKERNEFFTKLNSIKPVDSGGKFMKNINYDLPDEISKIKFLSERKFNICFEPSTYPGYVTEKILHAFYAKTIPIYWGSPTVKNDFNSKAFIDIRDFKNFDTAIEKVLEIDNNKSKYDEILNEPKFIKNIPPNYVNLNNFLDWFDSIVYKKIKYRE